MCAFAYRCMISRSDELYSYTCGAIWRTCNCTEVDEERRRQRTREQRHAQDTAARTEAADIAAAIRAVEEQERREAEEAERLERLRQEAEAARLAREAEVVRQREEERLTAINHKFVDLQGVLENLHYTQQKSMGKRHEAEMKRIKENMVSSQLAFDAKWALERAWMKRTNHDVIERLSVEHQTAIKEMDTRHEEEEDDIFLALRVHLRNKSNRSAREKAMVEKMKNSQLAERQSLLTRQTATMEKILRREKLKIAELEAVLLQERETEKDRDIKIAELVVRQVFADRMWFDTLVDERRSMLDEDERRLVRTRADGAEYGTWDLQSQVA